MAHEPSEPSSGPQSVVVGIDVSKGRLDCCIDPPQRALAVGNDAVGIAALLEELRALDVRLVLIEATGRHHRRVAAELLDAKIPVAVVNPQRVREFARASDQHRHCEKAAKNQAQLDDLVSRRRALVQVRVAEKNRSSDPDLPELARRQGHKLLRLVEQQIQDLDRAIAGLIERDDDWRNKNSLITSVPGVGAITAQQLIADLPELGTLSRGRIAKLVGLAPLNCDSGKHRGTRRIAGGRGVVRVALYMATLSAMRFCDRFRDHAQRLRKAGKPFKVIITACMRKLLITLNQMLKTNTSFQASPVPV